MQMNAGQSRLSSLPFNSQAYNFAPSLYRPNYSQPYIPEQTGNGAQNLDPIAFLAQFGGGPQLQNITHSHPNGGLNMFQNQQFTLPTHTPQLTGLPQNGDAPLCPSLISCWGFKRLNKAEKRGWAQLLIWCSRSWSHCFIHWFLRAKNLGLVFLVERAKSANERKSVSHARDFRISLILQSHCPLVYTFCICNKLSYEYCMVSCYWLWSWLARAAI